MGIWVVGPILGPGQRMTIADHAVAVLYHPRQVDKEPNDLPKGFACQSYKYAVLDPHAFVELDMGDEYALVEAECKIFSGILALSTTMRHRVGCGVFAHKNR